MHFAANFGYLIQAAAAVQKKAAAVHPQPNTPPAVQGAPCTA